MESSTVVPVGSVGTGVVGTLVGSEVGSEVGWDGSTSVGAHAPTRRARMRTPTPRRGPFYTRRGAGTNVSCGTVARPPDVTEDQAAFIVVTRFFRSGLPKNESTCFLLPG